MRLILLRHGQTDWNALDRYQGLSDVPLNATGEAQARAAAAGPVGDLLQDAGALVAVSSPLVRARRTAEIVLEAACGAVEPVVDPGLVELDGGRWEGLDLAEIAQRWPAEYAAWRTAPSLDGGPVDGEVLRVGSARLLRAAAAHVPEDADRDAEGGPSTLLVVAHGAVIRGAVGLLLGLEGELFAALERIGNARAAVLEGAFAPADGDGFGVWTLRGYGV